MPSSVSEATDIAWYLLSVPTDDPSDNACEIQGGGVVVIFQKQSKKSRDSSDIIRHKEVWMLLFITDYYLFCVDHQNT